MPARCRCGVQRNGCDRGGKHGNPQERCSINDPGEGSFHAQVTKGVVDEVRGRIMLFELQTAMSPFPRQSASAA